MLRADLSVAGAGPAPGSPAVPAPDAQPVAPAEPAIADPANTPSDTDAEAARPASPPWGGTIASSDMLRDRGTTETPAGSPETAPAPAANVPLWRRLPLGLIIAIGFLAFGAIGGLIFNASRSDSGEITKSGDLEVTDLRVGDCFDLKDPSAEQVGKVTALPCTTEHEYEMYFLGSMAEGAFPTEEGFGAWLDTNCLPAFEAYVGRAYDGSDLEIFWLAPTLEGWNDGDRSIQCAVYHPRIHRLTESLKGSAQ
jgi:hypothetical protein